MGRPVLNRDHARVRFDFVGCTDKQLEDEITRTVIKLEQLTQDRMIREAFYESVRLTIYWTEYRMRGRQATLPWPADQLGG